MFGVVFAVLYASETTAAPRAHSVTTTRSRPVPRDNSVPPDIIAVLRTVASRESRSTASSGVRSGPSLEGNTSVNNDRRAPQRTPTYRTGLYGGLSCCARVQ